MYLSSQFLFSFYHLPLNLEKDNYELSLQNGGGGGGVGGKVGGGGGVGRLLMIQ